MRLANNDSPLIHLFQCRLILHFGLRFCAIPKVLHSLNISYGLNLMLRKLTRHISTLAIRVVQFLPYLFFSHFSNSAFPNLSFRKKNSLGDSKSMAESQWASAHPTPPPPPAMLPGLVFSSFKVFW